MYCPHQSSQLVLLTKGPEDTGRSGGEGPGFRSRILWYVCGECFPAVSGVFACGGSSPRQLHAVCHKILHTVIALPLRMALVNARSITKMFVLNDIVKTKETETWQRNMKNAPLKVICPNDNPFISLPILSNAWWRTYCHLQKPFFFCRMVNVESYSSSELQVIQVGRTDPFIVL